MRICRRYFNLSLLGAASRMAVGLAPRPKLVVLGLLEQRRQDYWDSAVAQFGPGGLRRILLKGAHFPDCRHLASSFSATTIATLATGAWPAEHGIVAESWYDREAGGAVPASQEALRATTLTAQVAADVPANSEDCAASMPITNARVRGSAATCAINVVARKASWEAGTAPRASRSYQESATMPCSAGQAPVARVAIVVAEKPVSYTHLRAHETRH